MNPILLHADNPGPYTGDGNSTWFIDGDEPTLIDAGVGKPAHLAAIEGVLGGRPLARVLITHGHSDHISGVPALRAVWPAVEVAKFTIPGDEGLRALSAGESVRAGSRHVTVIVTPGHAADHVCFWDAEDQSLYGGDMVLAGTTVLIPAGKGGNLREYIASLERIRALSPRRIYPGHGGPIDDPDAIIARHLDHRHRREREVVACLARGVTTVSAIVAELYPDIHADVRRAAEMTVEAHLQKLREEDRIA